MTRVTQLIKSVGAVANAWFPDALMAGGAAAVSYGCALMYLPAGFVAGGAFLLVGGVILARGAK